MNAAQQAYKQAQLAYIAACPLNLQSTQLLSQFSAYQTAWTSFVSVSESEKKKFTF